jgi:hypothetical protein
VAMRSIRVLEEYLQGRLAKLAADLRVAQDTASEERPDDNLVLQAIASGRRDEVQAIYDLVFKD